MFGENPISTELPAKGDQKWRFEEGRGRVELKCLTDAEKRFELSGDFGT